VYLGIEPRKEREETSLRSSKISAGKSVESRKCLATAVPF